MGLETFPQDVAAWSKRGVETGFHAHVYQSHIELAPQDRYEPVWDRLSSYPYETQKRIIEKGKETLKKLTGKEPTSYASAGHHSNPDTLRALEELGFIVIKGVKQPYTSQPYHPSPQDLSKPGNMPILVIHPHCGTRFKKRGKDNPFQAFKQISAHAADLLVFCAYTHQWQINRISPCKNSKAGWNLLPGGVAS